MANVSKKDSLVSSDAVYRLLLTIISKLQKTQLYGWQRVFGQARTRILLWYVALMAFFLTVSIPAIHQILYAEVEDRIEGSLNHKREEFRQLLKKWNQNTDQSRSNDASGIFKFVLSNNIPEDDEFLLTFLNGKLYKYSPRALPEPLQKNSSFVKQWAKTTKPVRGHASTPIGDILYIVEPFTLNGDRGVYVVAHHTVGEREEVRTAVGIVINVLLGVLVVALILAWLISGRVLAPLQSLSVTARSISESDLTQRLSVRGRGEMAELAITFNEMMDRLQAAFASQRNFINDAGHELRTPITIIRGHLEVMGDDPQEQQETLTLVIDELDRMTRFVNDLILLAKAERPDFLQLETVNVATLTEELFTKVVALADRNWHLDARATGRMVGDRQRITQAVMNLAQNATQYTSVGDTISLGSSISKGKVRFWVRDTGEGIAPSNQQRIFERFARAANSRRRSEGAGLGLSIVQAIAEAHQGQVQIHSKLDVGSTFTIVLPLEPPQEMLLSHASHSHY